MVGDSGLEIAPGKDVDANPELNELGNAWNAVPTAKRWTPLDPIEGAITGACLRSTTFELVMSVHQQK